MLLSTISREGQSDADLHPVENPDMLLSATTRKGQPDADLHPIQNPDMFLSTTTRKGQLDADLHAVQYPHPLVSNKHEGPARCWLTSCSVPRAPSCQQQPGRASQMLTYNLFKTQSMLFLSATTRKGQPDADLQAFQNPEHSLVRNNQEVPARCWLTYCSKPRACSGQQQPGRASKMLTYMLFKPEHAVFTNK